MSKDLFRMKNKPTGNGLSSPENTGSAARGGGGVRPGGMLVQKRSSDHYNQSSITMPNIKVKVNSQATFGELKKMQSGTNDLYYQDQKIFYNEKERDSTSFMDVADLNASKEITTIRSEIDKLAKQVANIEMDIYGGKRVAETVLLNMIELFMSQLIKLDGITADGDLKLQRRMQVKRVQKYIETLDMLKTRNSTIGSYNARRVPLKQQGQMFTGQRKLVNLTEGSPRTVLVTTKWDNF